jgi:DNA-binding NarL/FixJ family response regulator
VNPQSIRVITADPALRNALVSQIERSGRFALTTVGEPVLDGAGLDDVVVTTPADCPAEECLEMVQRGARVIILTPVPRERERQLYTSSGASAYLPMLIDGGELMDAVDAALNHGTPQPRLQSHHCPR